MIPAAMPIYAVKDNDQKVPFTFHGPNGGAWEPDVGDTFVLTVNAGGAVVSSEVLPAVVRSNSTEIVWPIGRARSRELAKQVPPVYRLDRLNAAGQIERLS